MAMIVVAAVLPWYTAHNDHGHGSMSGWGIWDISGDLGAELRPLPFAVLILLVREVIPADPVVTGVAEATTIDVASKIAGRIETLLVKEGDMVITLGAGSIWQQGEALVTLLEKAS